MHAVACIHFGCRICRGVSAKAQRGLNVIVLPTG
jgi:hypothetical protein